MTCTGSNLRASPATHAWFAIAALALAPLAAQERLGIVTVTTGPALRDPGALRALEARWAQDAGRQPLAVRWLTAESAATALARREVDYVVADAGRAANLVASQGAVRLLAIASRSGTWASFGVAGAVVVRAEATHIESLAHLRGRRVVPSEPRAFAGHAACLHALLLAGLDPEADVSWQLPGGAAVGALQTVHEGGADAALLEAGELEQAVLAGIFPRNRFRILPPPEAARLDGQSLPWNRSTAVHAGRTLLRGAHVAPERAAAFARALHGLARDPAVEALGFAGFGPPVDDASVHVLLRALRMSPYDRLHDPELGEALRNQGVVLLLSVLLSLTLGALFFLGRSRRRQKVLMQALRAELDLRVRTEEETRRFQLLVESAGEFIAMAAIDGSVLYVNRAGRRLVGAPPDLDLSARNIAEGHPPASLSKLRDEVFPAALRGEIWEGELEMLHLDGTVIDVIATIFAIRDPRSGEPFAFAAAMRDIRELKRAQRTLQTALATAESANRLKSEFVANMSHELRTPLTAILGYAELLRDEELQGPAVREHAATICRNGEHLLALIGEVLDLSKIEAGKLTLERRATRIQDLLGDLGRMVGERARAKGLEFRVAVDATVPAEIHTDAMRLRQILLNLAGNAVKFTERGEVAIRVGLVARERRTLLRFDVADTGIGIPAEAAQRLFQPFEQVDASTTRRFGGTGLGLAISRRLALALGGDITVQSTPGQGSTFTLVIDAGAAGAADAPADTGARAAEDPAAGASANDPVLVGARILLAEDGTDNQHLISAILRRAGATVEVADDGIAACERVGDAVRAGKPFDLLLLDMQMPRLDGYGTAERLRREGRTLPIVALTAHAMAGDRERCLAAGCTGYATKPIDKGALLATLRGQLGRGRGAN
ncbi:MAG: response regulator [Planctomycetes bacterium]|nr:response regulator [Planctomycetota bacterium]